MALRRIYVVGAQSTGKTTLVNALAEHFDEPRNRSFGDETISKPFIIKEVARTTLKEHNLDSLDILSSQQRALHVQRLILAAQHRAESSLENRWYISDRSGVDPLVYAKLYAGDEGMAELRDSVLCNELMERLRGSLVLVCEPCSKRLVDDGVRLLPKSHEEWMEFHGYFCQVLRELGIEFIVLGKELTTQERVQFVRQQLYGVMACLD